ncbi:MAG: c-type cytochrome [Chloroflexota bacterium]|nr:c-type cytochrome [Chloroflexota bacterium]
MTARRRLRTRPITLAAVLSLSLFWVVPSAYGDGAAPAPNATGPGINLTATGPAAAIHGNPARGRVLFGHNCAGCHGDGGVGGIPNPGSDDGTVPPLNPIDPGFLGDSQGDPAVFAKDLDLFVQHGSLPSGSNPSVSMPAWGDKKMLSQQDLADVEAYVMMANGVYWPDRWAPPVEVQMTATQDGGNVTYAITLVNDSTNPITGISLSDVLPANMAVIASGVPDVGHNPGGKSQQTVGWITMDSIPQAGTLGPFMIVAQLKSGNLQPNVAQVQFSWSDWAGNSYSTSAVSDLILPGRSKAAASGQQAPTPSAPAAASASPAPTAASPAASSVPSAADIAAGKKVYSTYCSACHGPEAAGGINLGSATSADLRWSALGKRYAGDTSLIRRAILTGKDEKGEQLDSAMPRWQGQLTDAQASAILTYLQYGTAS